MKPRPKKPFDPDDELQVISSGVREPGAAAPHRWPWRAQRALVARGLMLYQYFDLAGVPPGRRPAAVRAKVRAWSPFSETDCRILSFAQGAGVFAWDAGRVRERLGAIAARMRHIALVPETAFMTAPAEDGVRLVRGIDGYEGQVWRDGHLQASRSWAGPPDEGGWSNFLRGAGLAPGANADVAAALVDPAPWCAQPIVRMSAPDALRDRGSLIERFALVGGSLVLMLATAVVTRDVWDIYRRSSQLRAELALHERAAGANRTARDQALAARQQVEILTAALARPNALSIQDRLLAHLPKGGTEIQELSFDGTELRVVLKAPPGLAREAIVKDLEQGHLFADVHEARDSPAGAVALVMNVRPPALAPAAQDAAPAAGASR